ncbi:COG4 transport domain-containing protein [Rhizoctonia solani]|uniref:COG4 transport domain-containing protein n=1 Tax=Rhizoctonia solani TaxID=456999 RepID=A0A8H8T1F2_9AGAM|nr:COG4 transport domain-containing protein [Rhizoctonia solani]QRW26396.1 COG4 transport domain-containing protein [Rhizoctonia solani]
MPKALPPSDVQNVVEKFKKSLHYSEIHSQTGVSTGMISRIRAMHFPELPKHSGGHPSKLSPTNICHATHLLTGPAPTTPCLVAQEISSTNGVPVSSLNVHWAVQKAGVVPFVKPKKPAMTKEHIKACYEFAMAHQHWTIDDWKRIQWSDETKINRFGSDGHHYVYKGLARHLSPTRSSKHHKHGGGHIMIGLDMEKVIFKQDNASSHKAHIVQDWFQENGLEVYFCSAVNNFLSKSPLNKFNLHWVLGHKGVEGNEQADALANKGGLKLPKHLHNRSITWSKAEATPNASLTWAHLWSSQPHLHFVSEHICRIPSLSLHPLFKAFLYHCAILAWLIQVIMGHTFFGKYRKQFYPNNDPSCPCGAPHQTLDHVLQACPSFDLARHTLQEVLGPLLSSTLFGTTTGLQVVAKFRNSMNALKM